MTSLAAGRRRRLTAGLVIVLVGFLLDQATKLWVLHGTDLPDGGVIAITPFLDFVLSWNRGISYGLFPQDDALGRWGLVGFSVVAIVVLSVWMARAETRLAAISLALVLSGAAGNLVDRVVYGAVVDFVYLNYDRFSWYVFNLADTWIVAGVVGLLYDSLRPGHTGAAKDG